jgi:integrase
MRVKLTKREIDAARHERTSGAQYLWDSETAGLGLRVYPSGRKAFVVTYRVRGKQRFYTIGRFGELTLDDARTEALEVRAQARRGQDPAGERLTSRNAPTMKDLAKRFMDEHSRPHKKASSSNEDEREWQMYVLPKLGHRKVKDITRDDLAAIHASMASTPAMANNLRDLLHKAFNLAEVWGWRPEGTNPCRHVRRYKQEKRERYLSATELGRLSDVLAEAERAKSENPYAIAAIRLLILTGCRRNEILSLRWKDVDFERRCLHLPDSKTGPKDVPLNGAALQVLAELDRVEGSPWVIPGRRGKHRHSLRKIWIRIQQQVDIEDVRVHDLRHTFASFGVNLGLSLPLVGKILGHSRTATTERYAHLADDPVRAANERIGDHISAIMARVPKAEVVAIGEASKARSG